jgi:low temperature requirement protein LtrA
VAKIDVIKEHIKGDRLFWFLSMITFIIFAEELIFEKIGEVQFIAFSIIYVASVISAIYFYRKLQKNIRLLDKL